jgi:hypothetical protein
MLYDRHQCLIRAEALLASSDQAASIYAALELRICMELMTYQKLRSFKEAIPESVLETWQPPQAMKALLEFAENATQSFSVAIGREEELGIPAKEMKFIGHHKSLDLKWLRKHYNKVSAIVHAPSTSAAYQSNEWQVEYLKEVLDVLKIAAGGNILGGGFSDVYRLQCSQCGKPIVRSRTAIRAGKTAQCFTAGCDAEFRATSYDDERATFEPVVTNFSCAKCNAITPISDKKIHVGVRFACSACGQVHSVVEQKWLYVDHVDNNSHASES